MSFAGMRKISYQGHYKTLIWLARIIDMADIVVRNNHALYPLCAPWIIPNAEKEKKYTVKSLHMLVTFAPKKGGLLRQVTS
jgi:hypothetical protein